jgi:hypothetical protein
MHLSRWSLILASCCGFAVLTLLHAAPAPEEKPVKQDQPFHARLLEIARQYKAPNPKATWGDENFTTPVDCQIPNWAPALCRMPEPGEDYLPAKLRSSASKDEDSHGQKLYFLYAKDKWAYLDVAQKASPVGQVLVKESWTAEEAREATRHRIFKGAVGPDPYAEKDGKKYHVGKLVGLYIMFKTEPKTPGTDEGWVYGTVSADGKQVTAAGRVESCMSCHVKAKHDRLFGLAKEDVQRIKTYYEKTKQVR